eukprot:746367-Hanusia_phi.AAC.4
MNLRRPSDLRRGRAAGVARTSPVAARAHRVTVRPAARQLQVRVSQAVPLRQPLKASSLEEVPN